MVQYNKNIKNKKKGFTLVELMVVLAITAILAALVGGGLIAYTRLARFEKNEANARTLFQTAQISLTRMETAGELDAFRRQAMEEGDRGDHFQNDVTVTDAGGKTLVSRTKTELDQNVAALYYDRTGAAAGNHNALVEWLLGDYIYDASLLNASICVEIDVQSGQIYSVFYDTKSDKLRFNQDGATNIYDRSYDHRRKDTLVGYYSAEDRVNVVQLVQTKLKVKNPRLTNGETLTLSWSGNSSLGDLDTSYTATAYAAGDTGENRKPLFTITIKRDTAGAADDNKQVITKMPVTIYTYNDAGQQTETEKELYFPLSYNKGSFVLTLDAMADAALLRACENSADVAATSLYSITRLLNDPKDIYIAMRAEPRENYSDTYTASKEETTNEENTLLAKGGTAVTADLKYFRHLYNLRWSADWDITDEGTYTLTPQASNSTGLNWTGGGVTVYCAAGEQYPAAKVPSLNDPVAWPTIPELGEKIVLTSKTTGLANNKTTRVPILNLQLSSKSVAKTGRAEQDVLADHYVGLIGENKGKISYITLRDPDIQVNVKTETVAADTLPKADQLKLTATKFVTALAKDDENWRDVRAVGALCGVNTGTLENCALTRGTNSSTSALVAAALAFDNTTTATQRNARTLDASSYTYYTDEPRGIGGLVGVAIPKAESVMQDLTVASEVAVAGLLVDKGTQTVTNTAADQKAEKARYAAAAAEPNDENSLWRSVGVGGVFGTVDAAKMQTTDKTNIVNNGFVTGNGFTGGIIGNLFTTGANTSTPPVLTGLRNNGTVSAGTNYKGDTAGDARSLVLGQFFGGIAGYGRGVTLQGCESVTRSDLTETQLKEQVKAGFDKTGALTDASPLKGDFVGGLVGYGKDITLDNCKTGKGYVLGSRFVGGLAGGFTGSGVKQNDTNSSDVFGSRYVGGIVSVNGSNSIINGMTNTGLVAAFGKNAAYVGGIVGVNDAGWGGSENTTATATVQNCANRMSGDNATDTRRINLLKELNGYADYVGGIAGSNGKNGVVTWDKSGTPTLGAILYGNNYVGGVAGYNDENATISNTSTQNLTISGQIVAAGKAVGGMIGLNCASTLPSATVAVSRVAGQQLVGGVIGANLLVGNFTVADGGAFNTDVASGRVEADAVAGGIIGYNRLLAAKPAGVTLEALLPKIDKSTGVLTDSTDAETKTDTPIILTGFWNKLNLQANIYVGGIVGANDAKTKLTIQKATNGATQNALSVGGLNPSNNGAFKGGVLLNALAGGRYDFGTAYGALAGGIIGYATPNTVLENCINYGTVAHKCAAGGFAGWNEGTITGGSMAASFGNREAGYTYLGGVAGVNGGLIQSAYLVKDCAVRGDSCVGGIAGVNLGGDTAASICTGDNSSTGTVEANQYAGGVAGANVGSISLSGQLQSSVTATGYAGGVAGINTKNGIYTGRICSAENANGAVSGSVTAANYAGGVAGTNRAEITRVDNHASVRASTKYAGGIAGVNDAGGTISYCSHAQNQVYATNGEAGGIAGNNNKDALIENVQVRADATAANGTAGGVTATNFGTIGQGSGLENNSSVSGCTITGTSESIGAVAAYNGKGATIRNVRLAENANVQFSTPAVTIGGLAGMNEGTVTGCKVENGALALNDGLRAGTNTVTLGGAVGRTTADGKVSSTEVLLDLTQNLDKYTNLGGVAGQNDGTLEQCTYSGTMGGNADTDGLVSVGARSTGSTVGGIAGLNNSTITGCEVKYIKLQVSGISNITTTQTADEKLASASHVGGIAGRNNAEIANSYVATERSNGGAGSIITARYGFVGGVAGSNNGTITGSGSKKALVSGDTTKLALVAQVEKWLGAADANTGINSMAAELTTGKTYANLMGVDTVSVQGYGKVYSQSGLAANDLLVALRGSNNSETVRAAGYLGGLAGFNSLHGTIDTSATGKWFVYSDNATTASTVGGIVGQNESNVTNKSVLDTVVNCAAVRRFTRVFETWAWIGNQNKDDTDNENIYKGGSRVVVHVGGVIGQQQNRSDDRWSASKVVNCGSVFNSRSANVGGVIAYWLDYGGTVQKCFNFGKITTNTNDGNPGYGAVGGVVGFIDQPISGGTTNVLSCRNYGQIWYKSNGANDCAGIIGKIEMKKVTDIMTLNIIDCVNSGAIKAESQAVGILAWIGPWNGGRIDNVTVNIDRCRNLNTNFTCGRKIGIVGSRGDGRGSSKATNVTNCFATVGTDWYPIAYLRQSYENVTGHGNYYIENSESAGKSFFKKDSRKLTTTKPAEKTGNWNSPNYDSAYNETAWYPSSEKVKAHRLYIGYNVTDEATDPYIAFLPTLAEDENGAAYSLWWISGLTSAGPSAQPNSAYIKTVGQKAYIYDDTGAGDDTNPGNQRATVMLRFGEAANSKVTNDVDITDITDEVIQNYYKYVLDSTKPAQPGEINVKASQVQDADNNVYGRYEVTWSEPNDKTASPAAYYRVEILPCDAAGTVAPDAVPYLKADVYQRSGNSFTLPVNVDTMLANGSDSWRYDKVRLEVTRVAAAGTDEIGASAVADYSVKQRLPGISAPSSITRVNGETDNADALLYTVSWSPSDDVRIDHYDLCVVDDGGNTVLTLPTTGNVGSLTLDLEQYQGKALRFRVIARRNADNITCFDGPDGALSQPETIVRRAAAPKVTASSFAPASPNQETFLNDLKLNMTLDAAAQGNVYFTGYIFSDEAKYTEIAKLAEVWQNTPTGQDKYTAQQKLTQALDEMLDSGDAELVIPKDSRTVGGSASVNDKTASYTFVPDGNGFTLTPDHAKQYLLPAVRVMPTDGTTASNWFYYILQDAAKAQLPTITLDAPVDAAEPERALGNAVYTQEVNLYNDPEFKSNRGTAPLELRRFTVEWTAVNKYTQADGTVRNLTDSYTFTVTPLDSKTKQPYSITVTTYDRDETDEDGNVTHKRGEIKTVTKTYDGKTTEIAKQTTVVDAETKETRIWYDLSVEPVYDKDNNLTGWESQPYDVTGTVEKDGGTLYYKAQTVPMLELVQEDGAEPVYRITLPELQEKVQDDSFELKKFTASVTLQTLAHSHDNGKTVASDLVKVPVNETNTADAAEDAQSMDSAESVAPAETAESTAAESAPASVPPVLIRARAALPVTTPETAAAPDETDAAETTPPERTETSDAS